MPKMTDKQAHAKLKKICEDTSRARNSRREKNDRHEVMNEALNDMNKMQSKAVRSR